jgi:hypothetical protein
VHDWTLVDAGIFHAFYLLWISRLNAALNGGLLPSGYYALPEQHAGASIPDILTLHKESADRGPNDSSENSGGTTVMEAPPQTSVRLTLAPSYTALRRTISIRHVSNDRLVAMLEIVSPSNKDRPRSTEQLALKATQALENGIHLLVIDLFPPTPSAPRGIYEAIQRQLSSSGFESAAEQTMQLDPSTKPVTIVALAAGTQIEVYLETAAIGAALPSMPLFLDANRYINVPLEQTYGQAFAEMPAHLRAMLKDRSTSAT